MVSLINKYLTTEKSTTNEQLTRWKLREIMPIIEIIRTSKSTNEIKKRFNKWLNSHGMDLGK